jgi:hypothetical protein
MLARVRSRLTYANVIATLALFLALGGSSYAALKLPGGSVGTKQLKRNAVTSPKVKPGSLVLSDLRASARVRLRGPAGPQGTAGTPGAQGPQGSAGPPGAPGLPATRLFASVRDDGELVSGSGVTESAHLPDASFTVTFDRSVENCTAIGTVGLGGGPGGFVTPGSILHADVGAPDAQSVAVRIYEPGVANPNLTSNNFSLAVFC